MEDAFFKRIEEEKEHDENEDDLAAEIQGSGGFEVKDRSYHLRTYKKCFIGNYCFND